ncbi:hypothetical protein Hypma_014084 [Hypsizygus marmoreus]|uniref:Uncharacterized protein n=1 Tax=Hypsizygus marmoreus TaxID=39966 RepID=A0A369KDV9_HYPMA|nr:hypothetical protein Hypma_014084 [Hypsizygus marmoreus]
MFGVVSRTFVNGAKAAAGGVSKIVRSVVKAPKAIVRKARSLGSSKPKLPPRSRGPSDPEAAAAPPNPDNDTKPKPKGPPGGSKPKKTEGIE